MSAGFFCGKGSAPKMFSVVADMMAWELYLEGIEHLIHHLFG